LPFDDNGRLGLVRQETTSGGPFAIVRAYHLTNQLDAREGHRGDLEVRLAIDSSARPEESMLVVFPYRRGTEEPLVGNSRNPVRLADWQDYIGAVVWTVDLSLFGGLDLTTTAELKPAQDQQDAGGTAAAGGAEVCRFVERKQTGWEGMESGTWTMDSKDAGFEVTNAESGSAFLFGFTTPPKELRVGQQVPFELTCKAPPGYMEQGAIGTLWQTTHAAADPAFVGFSGDLPGTCGANNSHPDGGGRGVLRFGGSGQPPGRRELVKVRLKAIAGSHYFYQFIGWWYDCG
jgi:hypothetical protein